jgi:acetyltransferase-like isoleucine patch superfamily enzyme
LPSNSHDILSILRLPSISVFLHREYHKVVVEDYAKVYAWATILPGVTIAKEAIVASGSMVTHDIPPGMVVAGSPAKIIRERRTAGRKEDELDHIWLF